MIKIYAAVNKEANLRGTENAAGRFGKNRGSGQIEQTLPPVRGCVRLWRRRQHQGLQAVCGLCARLERKDGPSSARPLRAEERRFLGSAEDERKSGIKE